MRNKLIVLSLLALLFSAHSGGLHAQTMTTAFPDPDAGPNVIGVANATNLYLGGLFSKLVNRSGVGDIITTGGTSAATFAFGDTVFAAIPDGLGGFYVAGSFTWVGGNARSRIARITSAGALDATFVPPVIDGTVYALVRTSSNLYAGGKFGVVNGVAAAGLARFNLTSGAHDATFTIGISGGSTPRVLALEANSTGTVLFVGGLFTTIGGQGRTNIARINNLTTTPAVSATFTNANGADNAVRVIKINGADTRLYVGGDFEQIGAKARDYIAKLDAADGAGITGWAPNPNGRVFDIELDGANLFACGAFTTIGGKSRKQMAKIDASAGTVPNGFNISGTVNGDIHAIAADGSGDFFVGGDFTTFDGSTQNRIARVDGTGSRVVWNSGVVAWRQIWAIECQTPGVFCGGHANTSVVADHIGRVLVSAGTAIGVVAEATVAPGITGFAFRNVSGSDRVLAVGPDALFAVGFTSRDELAEWTVGGGASGIQVRPTTAGGQFRDIAVHSSGTKALITGSFSAIERHDGTVWGGATNRNNIAEIDISGATATITSLDPNANGVIYDVVISDTTAYVAGSFTQIGGVSRAGLAAIGLPSGTITSWDPNPNGLVNTIVVDGSDIYLGGAFTSVGGASRNRIAKVDNSTGSAVGGWDPNANNTVNALRLNAGVLYVGGSFTTIGGSNRGRAAALNASTGALTSAAWNPDCNNAVFDIEIFNGEVVLAGSFTSVIGGRDRNGLAAFTLGTTPKTSMGDAREKSSARLRTWPNPMTGTATIELTAPADGRATLELYSPLGEMVRSVFSGEVKGGEIVSVPLRRGDLPPGSYLLRLSSGESQSVEQVVILE